MKKVSLTAPQSYGFCDQFDCLLDQSSEAHSTLPFEEIVALAKGH